MDETAGSGQPAGDAMSRARGRARRAVASDLAGVLGCDHLVAAGDRGRAELLRQCVGRGECWVHADGTAARGFVILRPGVFFGRDFIELLVVDPAFRRSGIGRELLRQALAAAATPQVFTSTNASNRPMQSLLRTEDWSFSGQLDGLDEGDPELVFHKHR